MQHYTCVRRGMKEYPPGLAHVLTGNCPRRHLSKREDRGVGAVAAE